MKQTENTKKHLGAKDRKEDNLKECDQINKCVDKIHKSLENGWDKLIDKKPISNIMKINLDHLGIKYAK